jgi:hypothetical protein
MSRRGNYREGVAVEDTMDPCRETAFCLALWYAVLTVLTGVLVIVLCDLDLQVALLAAANMALLFALVLMARSGRLTERNIVRSQLWRTLPEVSRPAGQAGAWLAQRALRESLLTFARGAAAVAVVLASLAYVSSGTSLHDLAGALHASSAHAAPPGYFTALPTN